MEILNFKFVNDQFSLAAFDVECGGLRDIPLKAWQLCKSKNGHLYVKPPAVRDPRVEGEKKWVSALGIESENGRKLCAQVLDLVKPFVEKLNSDDSPPF